MILYQGPIFRTDCENPGTKWQVGFQRIGTDVFVHLYFGDKEEPTHWAKLTAEQWEKLKTGLDLKLPFEEEAA